MPARCLVIIHSKQLQGIRHQQGLSHRLLIWENWWKRKGEWGRKSMPFTNVICQIELSSMGSLLYTLWESGLKESVYRKLCSWARQVGELRLTTACLQFLRLPLTSLGLVFAKGVQTFRTCRTFNLVALVQVVNRVPACCLTVWFHVLFVFLV